MKRLAILISAIAWGSCLPGVTLAKDPDVAVEDPAHAELRTLRKDLVDAVGRGDLDAMLAHMDPNIVITWINGEQSRGPQQVREYYQRMMKGDRPIVKSFSIDDVNVKQLTTLYGDTGVALGTAKSHFVLTDGSEFVIEGPWTAVVTKAGGKWSLAALHSSANMFDNPILNLAKDWLYRAAAGGAAVGLLLGMLIVAVLKRGRPATPAAGPKR